MRKVFVNEPKIGKREKEYLNECIDSGCAAPIVRAGAKPVLVDADPVTWNMRPDDVAAKITARTKAIMAVHIYGLPEDMDPLMALAKEHGLFIIEDAAQYRSDRLAKIARLVRAASPDTPEAEAVTALAEYVRQKIAKANLPARLKDLSVTIEKLALVAEDAGELELMNSLQRSMTSDDLFEFIKQAF